MTKAPVVAMLLDNHFGPDPRVELEATLLNDQGYFVRIVGWDRRSTEKSVAPKRIASDFGEVVRIPIPAPSGGGRHTFLAMLRFARQAWSKRNALFADACTIVIHDVYLLPVGAAIARSVHLPYIYDAHEEYAAMEGARYPRWWLRSVTAMETALARRAHAVVVPGESRVKRWTSSGFSEPIILRNMRDALPEYETDDAISWDLVYCGTLADVRRLDLLLALARRRGDLRIAIAGRGRGAQEVERAAATLSNVDYLGWSEDADTIVRRSRAVYYGLDPTHPYSSKACPNTLYDALRHRRPLIFFCGGEPELLAEQYRFGTRCAPDVGELAATVDGVLTADDWDFEDAMIALAPERGRAAFVAAVTSATGWKR